MKKQHRRTGTATDAGKRGLLADDDNDVASKEGSDPSLTLTINTDFAKRYESKKKKEEISQCRT